MSLSYTVNTRSVVFVCNASQYELCVVTVIPIGVTLLLCVRQERYRDIYRWGEDCTHVTFSVACICFTARGLCCNMHGTSSPRRKGAISQRFRVYGMYVTTYNCYDAHNMLFTKSSGTSANTGYNVLFRCVRKALIQNVFVSVFHFV